LLDQDALDEVLGSMYLSAAVATHGVEGEAAVLSLLASVRRVYEWLDPGPLTQVVVSVAVADGSQVCAAPPDRTGLNLNSLPTLATDVVTLQGGPNGWLAWFSSIDVSLIPTSHIAYIYQGPGAEHILIGGVAHQIPRLDPSLASQLIDDTFFELDEVLDDYDLRYARRSQCEILQGCWRTETRLMFAPKPEDVMQKSLHNHIKHRLRGNITPRSRREINEDIGDRVDIEITWPDSNRVAIIEIKWLGKSAPPGQTNPYTTMTPQEVRDGALQLANYLDIASADAPDHQFMGTLVVFDGRRHSVTHASESTTEANGMYFEHAAVDIDPTVEGRRDFRRQLRYFLEPDRRCFVP
jgi:hypothetical protein